MTEVMAAEAAGAGRQAGRWHGIGAHGVIYKVEKGNGIYIKDKRRYSSSTGRCCRQEERTARKGRYIDVEAQEGRRCMA